MPTYGTSIIRVRYWLSIMIRSPQPNFCRRVARSYAKQAVQIRLVGGKDVREIVEIFLAHLTSSMGNGNSVLPGHTVVFNDAVTLKSQIK
jgi:hypothetical protein